MKKMHISYWRQGKPRINFGEAMLHQLLREMGYGLLMGGRTRASSPVLMAITSELCDSFVKRLKRKYKKVVVWGSGYSHGNPATGVDIRALRGPLTAEALGCPGQYPLGDPCFLMPRFVKLSRPAVAAGTVYAPHWYNRGGAARPRNWANYPLFDVAMPVDKVVSNMQLLMDHSFVMTNALHVAICCIAYKIPFGLVAKDGDKINKRKKWDDVAAWLGTEFTFHATEHAAKEWWEQHGQHIEVPDTQPLLNAFPHDAAIDY